MISKASSDSFSILVLENVSNIKSNRQGPNVKQLITQARFNDEPIVGPHKCASPRCKCFDDTKETRIINFHKVDRDFTIRNDMNCESENLIYALFCKSCNKCYIGETGDKLRSRMRVHREGITNNSSIAVDRHIYAFAGNLSKNV